MLFGNIWPVSSRPKAGGVQLSGHNEDLRRGDLNSVAEGKEVNRADVSSSNRWTKRQEMIAAMLGREYCHEVVECMMSTEMIVGLQSQQLNVTSTSRSCRSYSQKQILRGRFTNTTPNRINIHSCPFSLTSFQLLLDITIC